MVLRLGANRFQNCLNGNSRRAMSGGFGGNCHLAQNGRNNRIVSTMRKWMAAQQSPRGFQASTDRAVTLDGLGSVFRTGGDVSAGRQEQRRDQPLVRSQQQKQEPAHHDFPAAGFGLPAADSMYLRITWNARATSCSISTNSVLRMFFLGLITTSTANGNSARCCRMASRVLRLIRLRSTAPPSTRPTVVPIRGPRSALSGSSGPIALGR